jgi:hypothetical protein
VRNSLDALVQLSRDKLKEKTNSHDFDSIVELWAVLIESPTDASLTNSIFSELPDDMQSKEHREFVTAFICEISGDNSDELKMELFDGLIDRHRITVMHELIQRFKFSFYAFIKYEMKSKKFEGEFWAISVMRKAGKKTFEDIFLPSLIQFSLLFHSEKAKPLLKRLCHRLNVEYSSQALSPVAIRRIVSDFQTILMNKDSGQQLINEWAEEAMKWTVGCASLHLAHTSLIILTHLNYKKDQEFVSTALKCICTAVCQFLKDAREDWIELSDFLNDVFPLLAKHFEGNENFCLQFLKSCLPFTGHCSKLNLLFQKFKDLDPYYSDVNELEIFFTSFDPSSQPRADLFEEKSHKTLADLLKVFSRAIKTPSPEMKRRIFLLSEEIVRAWKSEPVLTPIESEGGVYQPSTEDRIRTASVVNVSPYSSERTDSVEKVATPGQEDRDKDPIDIAQRAVIVICENAVQHMLSFKEALNLLVAVCQKEILAPKNLGATEDDWKSVCASVAGELEKLGMLQQPVVVGLTDLSKLEHVVKLLKAMDTPQIRPFTLDHKMWAGWNGSETLKGEDVVEKWMRNLAVIGRKLIRTTSERPSSQAGNEGFAPLEVPVSLPVAIVKESGDVEVCMTPEDFLALEELG